MRVNFFKSSFGVVRSLFFGSISSITWFITLFIKEIHGNLIKIIIKFIKFIKELKILPWWRVHKLLLLFLHYEIQVSSQSQFRSVSFLRLDFLVFVINLRKFQIFYHFFIFTYRPLIFPSHGSWKNAWSLNIFIWTHQSLMLNVLYIRKGLGPLGF